VRRVEDASRELNVESPVGKVLVVAQPGQVLDVAAPGGTINVRLIEVCEQSLGQPG